jgi:hypothetical protein
MTSAIIFSIFIILTNITAFLFAKKLNKKSPICQTDQKTKDEIKNIKFFINDMMKWRIVPLLFVFIIALTVGIYKIAENDLKKLKIVQNARVVSAKITQKYTKKSKDKPIYFVNYEYRQNAKLTSPNLHKGTGRITKKTYDKIESDSLLIVTYNQNNPNESHIGDISNLTIKTMLKNRFPFYCFFAGMYLIGLWGIYYLLFRIRTK